MKKFLLLCVGVMLMMEMKSQQIEASDNARFTLLTCTSGADLYSIFGHTAIRYEDTIAGVPIDWVYNYGTFEFASDFYWKFAQGKLDYRLSKTEFAGFQYEYILAGRGIFSQEMLIEPNDKKRLLRALEENYKPENRYYRYDFFYDNCATRVRDMLVKTPTQKVDLTYTYAHGYTFREAIQRYLDHMPWSDFGIDLALGMPCDKVMQKGDACFLPDSLMNEMHYASYGDGVLMGRTEEMLPKDYELNDHRFFTPIVVFSLFMVLQLFWGMLRMRSGMPVVITDRVLLFVTGLIGVMVFFLWFLTDHTTTKWNLNLLWANPINIYLAFASLNRKWIQTYFKILTVILLIIIVGWFFIPQRLHLATLPMIIGLLFITLRQLRPTIFGGRNLFKCSMPMKWNVIIGLALIVLAGCRKESTTWNSRYAIPLAHGSLTLDDIVPDSLLEIDEAGMWHLVFHESLTDIDVDSLATIPDTTIKQKFVIPFNSGTLTLPAGTQVFSDAIETQLGISGAELKYARMKSGMMHYTVKSYLNGEMTSQFELPGVTLGPSHVLITADTDPEVGGVPGIAQGSIDMAGYTIDLTGDSGNESNKLASNIVVSVSNDASTNALINGQDSILVELTFDNAQVEWAEGYFGNHVYQINEDVDFAGDVNMPTGVIYVEQARMNLDITNYIGADARLQFAAISASNAEADLALDYSPIYQALNITRALEVGGAIYPFSTSYMINETNSNFTSFIGMLPSSLHVDGEIEINPLGNISGYHDFIYADKALEADLTIDVPLRLAADVTLTDTLQVTIGDNIVASGELIFIAENYFPLDAHLQLKLVDGDETLLLEDGWIDAGIPGGEPGSSTPVKSEVHVPVSYETIQRLKDGDRMFVRVSFYTPNMPELYALYANYKIDFKLVADATVELEVH